LFEDGYDIADIKLILGHSKEETTDVYIHPKAQRGRNRII